MKRYAIFLGCTIPARQPNYELSARKTLEKLGVELVDLENFTCCCPPPIQSINLESSQAIAAYNICLAEEAGLNIIALCNGCFESLAMANAALKNDKDLKANVNEVLAKVGKEFQGTIEVKHFLQVLMDDIGLEKIKQNLVKPLTGIKVAPFYGCHSLRPSKLLQLDDPERPQIFENMLEALGAEPVEYRNKLKCCGGLLKGISDDTALELAREKLSNTAKAGADCISTLCPFCFVALDIGQLQVKTKFDEIYEIPILHYSELIALALGVNPDQLALRSHKIKADKVIGKIA
ncbi:CoB--CoM heterodisulfide reductase subunit B [Candidatus Bathyarchaeota archaeon]|nr:CoB--CoM heterodisulfide reductase subunit B [Candidatus Bathyarchaeota archaeon]